MAAKAADRPTRSTRHDELVATVKERYGAIAAEQTTGDCSPAPGCCAPSAEDLAAGLGYSATDLGLLPDGANLGLGCGAPLNHLELRAGETVLDLGSGAGIDALLAARTVGPDGRVIGVDMTPEMLARARRNAAESKTSSVEFREGRLEALPVDDSSIDAVTSNCVINLVPDKAAVFREIARVLRSGGRLVISDIVLDGPLPEAIAADTLAYIGCVAGAELRERYFRMVADAGLGEVEILKDVEVVAALGDSLPAGLSDLAAAAGISLEQVRGLVRSLTYRARKL
jgi:SAM-dependent methyltransferase